MLDRTARPSDKSRKRVLIFHPGLVPYRLDLFNALGRQYELRIVFLTDMLTQPFDRERMLASLQVDHRFMYEGVDIRGRTIRFGIGREIADHAPDVVVTHEFSPVSFAVAARRRVNGRRIPHLVWTTDNPVRMEADGRFRILARRALLPWIDGLVLKAQETVDIYRQRYRFARPIGIAPSLQSEETLRQALRGACAASTRLCAQHQLGGHKTVLYCGRLVELKRIDRLMGAFAAMQPAIRDNAILILVGDGPRREPLASLASRLGIADQTIFAGRVEGEDLFAWFNCGSVLALMSESETWGAVINEALIAGMPVVCSDRAGARVLVEGGVNGDVVDAGNLDVVRATLEHWLTKSDVLPQTYAPPLRPSRMIRRFEDAVNGFRSVIDAVTYTPAHSA